MSAARPAAGRSAATALQTGRAGLVHQRRTPRLLGLRQTALLSTPWRLTTCCLRGKCAVCWRARESRVTGAPATGPTEQTLGGGTICLRFDDNLTHLIEERTEGEPLTSWIMGRSPSASASLTSRLSPATSIHCH